MNNDDWHWDDPPREAWWSRTVFAVLVVFTIGGAVGWWLFFREVVRLWTR